MKRLLTAVCALLMLGGAANAGKDFTGYVNPFVGTDLHGHTFPGAAYPFGMIQLSPDTRGADWDGCSGYHYSDSVILGFCHTHLSGTGCADLCDLMMMPVTGFSANDSLIQDNYKSTFSHSSEVASPGYYKVHLDRWDVDVELTVGRRMGMQRYTYPRDRQAQVVIDLGHRDYALESSLHQEGNRSVSGMRRSRSWSNDQHLYFHLEFSRDIESISIVRDGEAVKALISFKPSKGISRNVLITKAGISSVSEMNAEDNLKQSILGTVTGPLNFEALRMTASNEWRKFLSKIEVKGEEKDMRTFYTALYHTAIAPCLYSDANGEYRGMDGEVHIAADYDRYTVFSLWDTFRSLHPLFNLIEKERTVDFLKSFLSIYDEAGKLPVWELWGYETNCMIGYNSAPVIADALAKGIDGFDVDKTLEALVASSNVPEFGIDVYRDNGLVLAEKEHESVSKTLEYANDDWCIAQVARYVGREDIYQTYIRRALFYRNIYDPFTGFMRPRINGMWQDPFNPTEVNVHYTEANSWQYSFHVQQDVSGLIGLCGGDDSFIDWLDELFSSSSTTAGWKSADMTGMIGQYAQGNEPSHHIAYLYPYVGQPWKTQKIVRRIMSELFSDGPDGLCGNEDCGQMSAWYVFSALGFYPVTPGSDIFVFGSPLFQDAVMHLENGRDFIIRAPGNKPGRVYVRDLMRNGLPYSKSYFRYSDIKDGSTFAMFMSETPDISIGSASADRPYSGIDETIVENPWIVADNTFHSSTTVKIEAISREYTIMYAVVPEDAVVPDREEFKQYRGAFKLSSSSTVYAFCRNADGEESFITSSTLRKVDNSYKVTLTNPCSRLYTGGGDGAIVDGVRGAVNFRLGGWQGFQDCDFEAVIDLGSVRDIRQLNARFLQDTRSWIVLPQYVEYSLSVDGSHYFSTTRMNNTVPADDYTVQILSFPAEFQAKARYIKVFAKNFGTLPEWHQGAGGEAFIFVDEVEIK